MGIAIVDARRLLVTNRGRHDELEDRHSALTARTETERSAQEQRRRQVYDEVLVPFRDSFGRLKNVDLAELAEIAMPARVELPAVELADVRLPASGAVGALAGGLTSGAGAVAATYAAVGAFSTASTGTPIAALSGAAATNATLAFLGGGSVAAGGGGVAAGTLVLGGVVAAPVLVAAMAFVSWRGRSARRTQRQTAASLDQAEAELTIVEQRAAAVLNRSRQVRALLTDLQTETAARLPSLAELVDSNDDYATYTAHQRSAVAAAVGLVSATVALMAAPLVDDSGGVSELSEHVLADTRARLGDLSNEVRV